MARPAVTLSVTVALAKRHPVTGDTFRNRLWPERTSPAAAAV